MEQISESTQCLPFLPGAGASDSRYVIVRTKGCAVKYRYGFYGRFRCVSTHGDRTGARKFAIYISSLLRIKK